MNTIKNILSRPKIVISIAAAVAVAIGAVTYGMVGNAPRHAITLDDTTSVNLIGTPTDSESDLGFPISGRVQGVSVKVGDTVAKGQVLATLDAGTMAGTVQQAKGALELAQAQYASLDVEYSNAKKQQDTLVANAYRTLLSGGLSAKATDRDVGQAPQISGTYACGKEGSYYIETYRSSASSGYSFRLSGLEEGTYTVTLNAPQSIGSCGLQVLFGDGVDHQMTWEVSIPNKESSAYVANKNAYDLAVSTREQVLNQYAANLGKNGSSAANVAKAAVDAAQGAYQSALGALNNTRIVAPVSGTVTFVSEDLKVGQSVASNETLISISQN